MYVYVHVAYINKKAGRNINALARVSRCLEYDSKICVLKAFVLSFYNYCPVVWHFVGMEDTKKIEKVQYRALKFVFNDFTSPYSTLREQSGLPLLYIQRIRLLLIEIYKMYNLLRPVYLHSILSKQANVTSTRNNLRVVQPICNTSTYGPSSARFYGSKLWNELDKPLKESVSLEDFKRNVLHWSGVACSCSTCKLCVLKQM